MKPSSAPETPFRRAKEEWDNRIGSVVIQARNWRFAFFGVVLISLGLLALVIFQFREQRVIPVIVGIDKERGEPIVIGPVTDGSYRPGPLEIKYFLSEFIRYVRAVPLDQIIIRQNWLRAYSFLRKDAANLLNELANKDENSPLKKIGSVVVSVQPLSVVQITGTDSYQLRWKETVFSAQGNKLDEYSMLGTFSLELQPPKDQQTLQDNPLGLFIKNFQWNREL